MSEGNNKEGSLTALSSSPSGEGVCPTCPSPSPPLSRCWEHLTTKVEAKGAAGCVGGYQGKIIVGMGRVLLSQCLEPGCNVTDQHSTSQLAVTAPRPPSLFTLSPHFWMPPLCSELRINSNLGRGDGEGAPMSSWRLESVRKSRRLGDTDPLDFQTLILQLPLHLEELWKIKLAEHLHRMQTKDLPSTVPHFSG